MSEPKVNLQGGGRTDNFGRLNAIYVNIKRMFGIPTGTAEYLLGLDENQNLVKTVDGGGGGAVTSVFGRTGVVAAMGDDYDSSQITNSSSVAGAYVTDALDTLQDEINNIPTTSNDLVLGSYPPSNPGSLQIFSDGVESMTFRYNSSTENFDFNISNNLPALSDGTSLLYSSINQRWQTTEKSNIQLDGYELPSANIIVGNTSNVATAVAMSGDIGISHTGATTIQDGAVTTAKIADKNVTLDKIQDIGQHKLLGRHDTGDGIVHQIGVTGGVEFNGQNIQIQNSGVTQAKLDATGAAAGKVLTTDGTAMTWETPAGGGLTLPIDETVGVYSNEAAIALTLSQPSAGYTRYPKGVSLSIENFTGDGTGQGIGLEITGADGSSSGGPCYSLAIKSGDPISTTHILNTEQNYLTIDSSHVRIGGVYEWNEGYAGQSSFAITGSLNIDINNPSIPIGDGSVTETKLGDSSVTQAKISATGADVGKVLTTDGTTMTWETPNAVPTGTADNTTRFNASGQLVETNVIAISDAADVYVTGNTFDVILNTGGSEIYMDGTSAYISLENGDNLDGGGLILSKPGGPNLTYGLDAADSIWTQSVTYLVKLDANTYTGNGSILVGEYDVAEDVPKWGFRNIADYTTPANGSITQAKLSATGAAAGKVLTTDGTDYSWQTPSGAAPTVSDKTTAYGLVVADSGNLITTSGTNTFSITVPTNATQAITIGTTITILTLGSGIITIAAAGGVTLQHKDGLIIDGQYAMASLTKIATNTWYVNGRLRVA